MSKKTEPLPRFQTEAEERAYWESHDSAVDWGKAERVRLPNSKRRSISGSRRLTQLKPASAPKSPGSR
jgi:hypothetical protein